jgi:alpha-tubulin suppressor-like RCC1 family protein
LNGVLRIAAGSYHTCALLSDGAVECWGANFYGQLGNGTTGMPSPVTTVSGLTDAASIAGAGDDTCVVRSDGTVKCWGWNLYDQLGNGTPGGPQSCAPEEPCSNTPVEVLGLQTATAVTAGADYFCALRSGGAVECWGINVSGQLGGGTTKTTSPTPVAVSGLSGAIDIAAGANHTCALLADGTVECWGANYYGQLGNGTTTGSTTPVPVSL